jgi:hypothetical protein
MSYSAIKMIVFGSWLAGAVLVVCGLHWRSEWRKATGRERGDDWVDDYALLLIMVWYLCVAILLIAPLFIGAYRAFMWMTTRSIAWLIRRRARRVAARSGVFGGQLSADGYRTPPEHCPICGRLNLREPCVRRSAFSGHTDGGAT